MCLRTLIDRKRKRFINAVDVGERLHDPTDPSTERMAPPSSAHVQLDDVPRTPIQPSVEGEFRQHDGVMTVMMKLPTQGFASALQRYDRGGNLWRGAPHMAGRDQQINLCVHGVPLASVYKGGEEGRGWPSLWRALGVLLPSGVGFPPFHVVVVGVKEREERREGRRGCRPSP